MPYLSSTSSSSSSVDLIDVYTNEDVSSLVSFMINSYSLSSSPLIYYKVPLFLRSTRRKHYRRPPLTSTLAIVLHRHHGAHCRGCQLWIESAERRPLLSASTSSQCAQLKIPNDYISTISSPSYRPRMVGAATIKAFRANRQTALPSSTSS